MPVLLPSGDRAHVGVGTTIEARHAPGRPAVQDPAFAETCAWAVRASDDRGDHSGLLDGSVMEDPWERDPGRRCGMRTTATEEEEEEGDEASRNCCWTTTNAPLRADSWLGWCGLMPCCAGLDGLGAVWL